VLPPEEIYPATMSLPEVAGDLCTIPENKYKEEPFEFKDEECYFLSGCGEKYPYAIGLSYNCL